MSEGPSLALSNALSQMISIRKDRSFRIHDARSRREQKKKEDEEEERGSHVLLTDVRIPHHATCNPLASSS